MNILFRRLAISVLLVFFTYTLLVYERAIFSFNTSKVSYIDVGQGDSILIQSPSGKQLLIDGGRSSDVVESLRKIMPYFDYSIDVVIGTHPDADHIGGLPKVLEMYDVGAFFEPGSTSDSKIYESLEQSINVKQIPHILARENMVIDFGDGAYFVMLFPGQDVSRWETNNSSIVGMYVHNTTSFLFTGDAPVATEQYLLKKYSHYLDTDVLKLGHHGSRTSSSNDFLKYARPGLAIISAGKGNSYGHPHEEVIERLNNLDIPYFSTAEMGTITLGTDGSVIRLQK